MLQLRPGLSFCFLGERAVLLDLDADRYYLLSGEPLRVIRDAMAGRLDGRRPLLFPEFGSRPILVEGPAAVAPVDVRMPTLSALEADEDRLASVPAAQLFAAQCRASFALRVRGLRGTLARWRGLRPDTFPHNGLAGAVSVGQYYAAKRALVPLRRSCVPDSLALMRLLWRRGIDADLLFGVRLDPFAAHCWVQYEDHLLSDPLSSVADFTPIFRL